jgi:hypothetical protein
MLRNENEKPWAYKKQKNKKQNQANFLNPSKSSKFASHKVLDFNSIKKLIPQSI